ncbi:MAG TPA: hypothetical protein VJT73_01255 [Polyangiaceae bacterium]|nr:hypothetical protein [Polyangiaceae bacterium]
MASLAEFLEVVRKNLGATDVRILKDEEVPPASEGIIVCELPLGQMLAVSFANPPTEPESARRRLEMLVRAFSSTLTAPTDEADRPANTRALHDQLAALVERATALDAFVIDAHSPAIWGGASDEVPELIEEDEPVRHDNVIRIDGQPVTPKRSDLALRARSLGVRVVEALATDPQAIALIPKETCEKYGILPLFGAGSGLLLAMANPTDVAAIHEAALVTGLEIEPALANERLIRFVLAWNYGRTAKNARSMFGDLSAEERASREAAADAVRRRWMRRFGSKKGLQLVRSMPELATLHRGGHLNRAVIEQDFACIARSFAGIYVLVVVFGGPFDELKAKHAIVQALPTIEALVLALPPRDPPPSVAGARAARRPLRR